MTSSQLRSLDIPAIRSEFPVLEREVHPGVKLVYLDSAASSQKPRSVLAAMLNLYEQHYANVHRGIHRLAEEATEAFEAARAKVAGFIGASSPREIVFTKNTTEAINLVAHSWGRANLKAGDSTLLTEMEHHSNIVPWLMLAKEIGFEIHYVSFGTDYQLDQQQYRRLLETRPKLVGFTMMSNVLGTITPVAEMTAAAHAAGAVVLVDGAQAVPHLQLNVAQLGVDFLAFSAHKMCGPSGIGALYGRRELLERMPPFLGGGEMIKRVRLDSFEPNEVPHKFEAGTPPIAEAVGFGAAVDYLNEIGLEAIAAHEKEIIAYALERLEEIPGVTVYGPAAEHKGGVAAFSLTGVHAHDVAQVLDQDGVAVRAGHHCAQPLHEKFDLPATARASFYLYNIMEEVDCLVHGIYRVKELFRT